MLNKSSKQLIHLLQQSKKYEHFQLSLKEKKSIRRVSFRSLPLIDALIYISAYESGNNFFRERECKNENNTFFPRKVSIRTPTIMYVSLVTTSDQNLSRLPVHLI